jgi:antitoxin ParD1/3/4
MASHTFNITLPQTFADLLRKKVSSGEFESESDVVLSALMALEEGDSSHDFDEGDIEKWLRDEVVPIALRMEANPDEGYSGEEVLAMLKKDIEERSDRATNIM